MMMLIQIAALILAANVIKVTCFPTWKNSALTPKGVILTQMEEPRPLPMGMFVLSFLAAFLGIILIVATAAGFLGMKFL